MKTLASRFFVTLLFTILTALLLFTASCKREEKAIGPDEILFSLPVDTAKEALRVSVSFPNANSRLDPKILVEFNKPVLDNEGNITLRTPFFKLEPDLSARKTAISMNHIEYELSRDIKPENLYKLTLNEIINIANTEYGLEQNDTFYLRTNAQPVIKDAFFTNVNRQNNSFNIQILLNFSLNPRHLHDKISLKTANGLQIPYSIEHWTDNSIMLRVNHPPFRIEGYRDPVHIEILRGIQNKHHPDIRTASDFTKTLNFPVSTTLRFYNYEVQEAGDKYNIILNFSDLIADEDLEKFITVRPDIVSEIRARNYSVVIEGDFTPDSSVFLEVKPGILSIYNNLLINGFSDNIRLGNLSQMVSFEEKGTFLRKDGKKTLKFSYRNTREAKIEVYQVMPNNIPVLFNFYKGWTGDLGAPDGRVGNKILEKKISLDFVPNKKQTHYIDLAGLLENIQKGFYYIAIYPEGFSYLSDTLWLCITDIGLITKYGTDRLSVWAVSLTTGAPLRNIEVSLFSLNNQLLDKASTDRNGMAVFKDLGRHASETGMPFMVFAQNRDDFSFIDIYSQSLDLTEYDTHGTGIFKDDYNSYFFSDRNLYRPGDSVYTAGIVRKRDLNEFSTVTDVPVKINIRDANHTIVQTSSKTLDEQGTVEFRWDTSDYQQTGHYTANFILGKTSIGSLSFQIEEFIPQRIRTTLSSDKSSYKANETLKLTLEGQYLFNAPVSNGNYTIYGNISPETVKIKGLHEYYFGIFELEDIQPVQIFRISGNLDDKGLAEISLDLGKYNLNQYCKLDIKAEITEQDSGRPVEDSVAVFVDPFDLYLGLNRHNIEDIQYQQINTINGIVASKEGRLIKEPRDITLEVYHISYRYIYYYDNYYGRHRYRFEKIENLIKSDNIISKDGRFSFDFNTTGYWGAYKIVVKDLQSGSSTNSVKYPWWWGYGTKVERNKAPYYIDIIIDKKEASPGERAELVLNSPFNGNLLLTINSNDVLSFDWHTVSKGHNAIRFRVPPKAKDYNNVYVSAYIINSEYTHGSVPLRALGMANIAIKQEEHRLNVDIRHAETVKPNSTLQIDYTVKNHKDSGKIAIFAVDEGILQIRRFRTPDPYGFFFQKSALGISFNDILGMIMPEFSELYTGRSGYGDFEADMLRVEGDVGRILRVEPVAFWSGLMDFSKDGKGSIEFELPNFLGRLRVMAVAVSNDRFGSFESFTIVKDNIQIITTLPRFLTVGDQFEIPVTIINDTGAEGEFTVDIYTENISIREFPKKTVSLQNGQSETIHAKAAPAGNLGHSSITFIARGNNEETFQKTIIPILPNAPTISQYSLITCREGETDLNEYTSGWLPEFERTFITLSSLVYASELEYLKYLIRYPYGCLEQTVSSAFPLLYLRDIETIRELSELVSDRDMNQLILSAISNILALRLDNRGFTMWQGQDRIDLWSTVYATHFLIEANEKGFPIDQSVLNSLGDFIINQLNTLSNSTQVYEINTMAYSYYVLALMKRTRQNDIDFFMQRHQQSLLPESEAFIAGAYANLGNMQRSKAIIQDSFERHKGFVLSGKFDSRQINSLFYSEIRQKGIILNILLDMGQFADEGLKNQLILKVIQGLRTRQSAYLYSTQELVWGLRAFVRLLEQTPSADALEGHLYKDNERILSFDGKQRKVWGSGLTAHDLKVVNNSPESFYAILTIEGIKPGTRFTRYAQGIEVKRVFLDERGNLLSESDMLNIRQGQDIYARISIIAQSRFNNIAVVDRIGAGFEIENPRITNQVLPPWIDQGTLYSPSFIDIKDHQIAFFGDIGPGLQTTIIYKIRALTRGSFFIPPVTVEVMYDPMNRASDSSMNVKIN